MQLVIELASRHTGRRYSSRAMQRAFDEADIDKSGGIDFREFMQLWSKDWMRSAVAKIKAQGTAMSNRPSGITQNGKVSIHLMDSRLPAGEAEVLGVEYAALLDESLDDEIDLDESEVDHLRALFAKHDADRNGHIDSGEFAEMMLEMGRARGKCYSDRQVRRT